MSAADTPTLNATTPDGITTRELLDRLAALPDPVIVPHPSRHYWARKAGVELLRTEIINGRANHIWPTDAVEKIAAAYRGRVRQWWRDKR